jgi:type II secretory ATPase GspE/PulE/Tfp pilus assembly ATPase PilB-like protein
MVGRRASVVALAPAGEKARLLYVIDGVTAERPGMDLADSERVIEFLKAVAGMDVEDRRHPQKGSISIDLGGARSDMEVRSDGTTKGQRMMFRVIQEAVRTELPLLGMPEDLLAEVEKLAKTKNGLFIASGRRGSGVTSTLYSILRQRDAFIQNVVAVEATPALDLENIAQHPYHDDSKLPQVLSAVLQRGADVLMVDNCPDGETAKLIVKAAAKRPVLLGMQAGDSFVALAKWVQLCGSPGAAVAILRAVMCQLLLRQLCVECREPYRPDPQRLAKLNLAAEKIEQFYRPGAPAEDKKGGVCDACQGSGYRGRTAAFELLLLNRDIRQLITEGATVAQIRSACRKNNMLYLQEQALRKVIDGSTSVQEVIRVTQQARKT